MPGPTNLRFGVFEADLRSRELRKRGARIKIPDQPFQILAALLERPGELVTREELQQKLWPSDTFVDFDHSLNAAIKRLRDALGESADAPMYIETLPKRGYRFLGKVVPVDGQVLGAAPASNTLAPEPEVLVPRAPAVSDLVATQPPASRRWLYASGALLLGLLVIGGLLARNWVAGRAREASIAKVIPFTADEGAEMGPSFSPDGKQAAFVKWDGHSNFNTDIFLKLIGGTEELQLTHGSGWACCIAWSPDSLTLAYERCAGDSPSVRLVPALGGPERRLVSSSCDGTSWSPDGKLVAFVQDYRPQSPKSIFLVNADGTQPKRLTSPPPADTGDIFPSFSPDGSMLAYVHMTSAWVTDLYVVPVTGGEPRRLTSDKTGITGLSWTADGRSIVFASRRGGSMSLWRVSSGGGSIISVPFGGANSWQVNIARQGNRLLYTQGSIHPNIWQVALSSTRQAESASALIVSTTGNGNPQFSPDGRRIAFYSQRSGSAEIWICSADGTNLKKVTALNVLNDSPRWSPDGSTLAFDSRPTGHSQVFVVLADGGAIRPLTSGESENTVTSWSRDGKWIYFASNRTGPWQIWKISPTGGEPVQVTDNGGFTAFESADGQELFYAKGDERGIWKRAVAGGLETKVLDARFPAGHWALGRDGVYFVDSEGAKPILSYYDFASRSISRLATLDHPVPPDEAALDVSQDERRVLVMQVVADEDIMLVESFQ